MKRRKSWFWLFHGNNLILVFALHWPTRKNYCFLILSIIFEKKNNKVPITYWGKQHEWKWLLSKLIYRTFGFSCYNWNKSSWFIMDLINPDLTCCSVLSIIDQKFFKFFFWNFLFVILKKYICWILKEFQCHCVRR